MEHRKAPTSSITMTDGSNHNNSQHNQRKKRRTAKRQQLPAPSITLKYQHVPSVVFADSNRHGTHVIEQEEHLPMKNPLGWTKKWTKWFSSCGSERVTYTEATVVTRSTIKRARTKSENDLSKRASIEHDEKKKLSATTSNFALEQNSNENLDERSSRRSSQQHQRHHHHQSNERVNNSNTVLLRDNTRRYSNPFFTSARVGGGRTSIAAIPLTATTTTTTTAFNTSQQKQPLQISRSVDRLHSKSNRRELRYEEHDDYIPPPLHSIHCHPTIDQYAKSLNQSTYFSSNRRRSQVEAYQLSSINNRVILPKSYSSNIPHSQSVQIMSRASSDNHTYGRLSECHSPLTPLENSSVKAPRRIESNYSQFPLQQEPVYANTQSLYDNILYPQSTSKVAPRNNPLEKRSCASQTQLTWTMATFSSFVDLENQSAIIPQPDPNTLYSVVQHYQSHPPPSASPETVEQMLRRSPRLQYLDEPTPSSHYQRPRSPASPSTGMVEKRDGSFQTLLSIAPNQDIQSNRQLFIHDSTPSPNSTGSPTTTTTGQQQRHHHHHRKHKSRNNTNSGNISTRDVGLQVNIQTVKKITFTSQKSDESSLTSTTPSSPPTLKTSRELKNVQTNTEPLATKRDMSTSYESSLHVIASSSQTTDSSPSTTTYTTLTTDRQTKAAQTTNKTVRDQSIGTNNLGLFVCDLSSLLKNGSDEASALTIKRKS